MPQHANATLALPAQLEVFFDLSCPFCLLAKVTIERLIRADALAVSISWSPLILLPSLPARGIDFQSAHASKYGDRARPMQLDVEQRAASLGVKIDHSRITKVPNTIDAHRAVRFAARAGRAGDMIEALLRAYFEDGCDITDRCTLADVVHSVGLDAREFRTRIDSDWLRTEVFAAHENSMRRGARSVPSYRLNGAPIENTVDLIPELRSLGAASSKRSSQAGFSS